ncbi:hypothetical protein ABF176_002324 [Flavobacterium psychrophilum]
MYKKTPLFIILSILSLMFTYGQETDSIKLKIFDDAFFLISMEKVIYESPFDNNFYLKFSIENKLSKKVGINLTEINKQIYPNSWCYYCKRPIWGINEGGRTIQSENSIDKLIEEFNKQNLNIIAPNSSIYYYRNINEFENEIIDFEAKDFHIILDGEIVITDGEKMYEYKLYKKSMDERGIDLPNPINVKKIEKSECSKIYTLISIRPQGN